MQFDFKGGKKIIYGLLIILAVIFLLGIIKGADSFFYNRQVQKEYDKLQKQYNEQKKLLDEFNQMHRDSIEELNQNNSNLMDSVSYLKDEVKRLENEKPKIVYRVSNMSISEQQSYFANRYKQGRSPRQYNGSSGNNRFGAGRFVLRTVRIEESGNRFFKQRY